LHYKRRPEADAIFVQLPQEFTGVVDTGPKNRILASVAMQLGKTLTNGELPNHLQHLEKNAKLTHFSQPSSIWTHSDEASCQQ
jgi:hypothetical protein